MEKLIKVGVIGPLWIRESLKRCFAMFPSMEPVFQLSDQLEDASIFTRKLGGQVDCFLFSGKAPYLIAKKEIPPSIPSVYIPLKGSGLFRALYLLKNKTSFSHISFDGLQPHYIDEVKETIQETFSYTSYEGIVSSATAETLVAHHMDVAAKHPDCVIVTSLKIVHEQLSENGFESAWIKPTEDDMIVILERLLLSTAQRKQKESQIVCGIIKTEMNLSGKKLGSGLQLQQRQHSLHKLLLDFSEQIDGYLIEQTASHYFFVTNRGTFERVTEGYKSLPLLNEAKLTAEVMLSIGIGFGMTAFEAGMNAQAASYQAIDYGGQCAFIVREDRKVLGPIDLVSPLQYPLSVTDGAILRRAEELGANAVYLAKALAIVRRNRHKEFTAYDISNTLGITIRSAHRLLQTWMDAEIIKVIGTEKYTTRGRPRQVFTIVENEE